VNQRMRTQITKYMNSSRFTAAMPDETKHELDTAAVFFKADLCLSVLYPPAVVCLLY
jgi:hypothetical protein